MTEKPIEIFTKQDREAATKDAYNRWRIKRGMGPVDSIGANKTPEIEEIRDEVENVLTAALDSVRRSGRMRDADAYEMLAGNDAGVLIAATNDRFANLPDVFPCIIIIKGAE